MFYLFGYSTAFTGKPRNAQDKAEKEFEKRRIEVDDSRTWGKILKELLHEFAREEKEELKLNSQIWN
ncbi:MAG: hypothetical protein R6V02_12085 [Candidatus Aminicenantes bacterium]